MFTVSGRSRIEQVVEDLRDEPEWRSIAGKEMDYYDGNQLDSEYLSELDARGMFPVVRNLVGPAIDVVLGMEARNRLDFRAFANEDESSDVAVALSGWLHEWERRSKADYACSEAYKAQVSVGLGWVEVGRNHLDPFGYPHRCWTPSNREMYWDWRAREPDLSDARYLLRRKWFDRDVLLRMFPKKRKMIQTLGRGSDYFTELPRDDFEMLNRHVDHGSRTSIEDEEWINTDRDRLCLHELWFKEYENGSVLRLPDLDMTVLFEEANPRHHEMVAYGIAEKHQAIIPRMKLSWWIGPHPLGERDTPYKHNDFPYVPFIGMREGRTGVPYGLIRRMMSPQDEVNTRLTKMLWLLSAKRLIADSDAFDMPWERVVEEIGRPDAAIPLDPKRKNRNHIPKVDSDRELAAQQFTTMQEAQKFVSEAAGIYAAMQGKSSAQQSGAAIESLVEQGSTTLAEINDNFRSARAKVGELGMSNLIQERMNRQFSREIERGKQKSTVWFNRQSFDEETGEWKMDNRLDRLQTRVVLSDVPSTPTYRAQFLNSLMELVKSLPDDLKRVLIPMIVEAGDLPRKDEIAESLRQAMGQGEDDPEAALQAQIQQEEQLALEKQAQQAKIASEAGKADQANANSQKALAEAERAQAQVTQILEQIRGDQADRVKEDGDRILQTAMQRAQMQGAA